MVILPGNHDPALPDCIYVRGGYAGIPNVSVLGITHDEAVAFPDHEVEIWGHAHRDYENMVAAARAAVRAAHAGRSRWRTAITSRRDNLATPLRPSWLFSDDAIAATRADYLALGHWDRAVRVGNGIVPAYYSGSPELAQTVNVIRLTASGEVLVPRTLVNSHARLNRHPRDSGTQAERAVRFA